ncbi:hypothetical protein D9M71_290660 [compost metagenome]
MQHAVDAKAHRALLATGLDVDVAGALLERVLEQPVDDVDDVGIVGVRLLVAGAEVEQLFEIAEGADVRVGAVGPGDRLGQTEKFDAQALDVHRVGHHALDRQFEHVGQVSLPAADIRLGAGHGYRLAVDGYREDLVALGEGIGHQRGHGRDVDFQWVDAQVRLAGLPGQPQGQALEVQRFAGAAEIVQLLAGNELQRMHLPKGGVAAAGIECVFGRILADKALGDEFAQ